MAGCRDRREGMVFPEFGGPHCRSWGHGKSEGAVIRVTEDTRLLPEMPPEEQMGRHTLTSFFHIPPSTNAKSSQELSGPKV